MNKIVDKECDQCGTMMHGVNSRKKYCPECTRLRNIDMQAKHRAKIKSGEYTPVINLVDKECEQCGRMMHNVAQHKRFCAECAADRNRDSNGRRYAKAKAKKRVLSSPKNPTNMSVDDVVHAATAAGMTYGQLALHNRLESERNDS